MINNKPPRDGYGEALLDLCRNDENILVLDADVAKSTRTIWVKEQFPNKFLDVGISEQDLIGISAGLASEGIVPFASTYGVFLSGRGFDQIRTTVCYDDLNVKLVGAHAGISVGPDGATHQALEDMALMSVLPNMTLIAPCDSNEAYSATMAMFKHKGPCYIRFGREAIPLFTNKEDDFQIGKAKVLKEGNDCTVFACGSMVHEALMAQEILEKEGISISVVNVHTIKPLDNETVLKFAKKTNCAVIAQEHQKIGGLCGVVSQYLAQTYPVPIEYVGVADTFGESGEPAELMKAYGLTKNDIVLAVKASISKKK